MSGSPPELDSRSMASRPMLAILLACAIALGLGACGTSGDGGIPPDTAEKLINDLEKLSADLDANECTRLDQGFIEFERDVNAAGDIPSDVKAGLQELTASVRDQLSDCEQEKDPAEAVPDEETLPTTPEEPPPPESTTEETPIDPSTDESTDEKPAKPDPETDPGGPDPEPPPGGGGSGGGESAPPGGGDSGSGGVGPARSGGGGEGK